MKRFGWIIIVLWLIIAACSPPAAPITTPSPAMPTLPPVQPTAPKAPALSPEEAAWAKVIDEAKKEGRVTPYTFFMVGDAGKAVAQAFEKKYGIKVDFVTGIGSVLMERIKSETAAKKSIADTYDTAISMVAAMKALGLTQSWGPLPVLSETGVWIVNPVADTERHIVSGGAGVMTTFLNTQLVKPGEEPKSYNDLLSPEWKGKIVVASPVTAPNIMYLLVTGILNEAYVRRLAQQSLKVGPTIRDAEGILVRGEAAIMVPEADSVMSVFAAQGAPVKPIDMAEGATAYTSLTLSLMKEAPHPNAARLYMNWLLSPEGQQVYFKAKSAGPIRKDVPDFRPASAQINYKKLVSLDLPGILEMSRLQNERIVAKWLGIE